MIIMAIDLGKFNSMVCVYDNVTGEQRAKEPTFSGNCFELSVSYTHLTLPTTPYV